MNKKKSEQPLVRRKYSSQFQDRALEQIAKDGVRQVAKDLGLSEPLLCSWKAQQKKGSDSLENQKLQQAELARLKRNTHYLQKKMLFYKRRQRTLRRNPSEVRHD